MKALFFEKSHSHAISGPENDDLTDREPQKSHEPNIQSGL
jgi:hypothetical protein